MKYYISGNCTTDKGKIRNSNQDNFYFNNKTLEDGNNFSCNDLSIYPILAVFDGMGGEKNGDIASSSASEYLKSIVNQIKTSNDLKQFQMDANTLICSKNTNKQRMGTTSALCLIDNNKLIISNLGDTKIYRYRNKVLEQLSFDHVEASNSRLTQHLGILESEMIIEPYLKTYKLKENDQYLICSDGLTNMISEEEIIDILKSKETDKSKILVDKAINNGGKDNITVIYFKVEKINRKPLIIATSIILLFIILFLIYFNFFKKSVSIDTIDPILIGSSEKINYNIKGYTDYKLVIEDTEIATYTNGYITGNKVGITYLIVLSKDDEVLYKEQIKVFPN